MPLNTKGKKILASMIEQYGEEKGTRVFHASVNAGKITGVDMAQSERINDRTSTMFDSFALEFDDAAGAKIIDGGYMRAMPKIARTGIQIYNGKECGRDGVEKVRVFRPQDQVFGADAVKSYTHLPVTLEHPGVSVDANNWRKFAVGETGDEVLRDGGTVRVPMMLRDAAAIEAVREGKNQISVGYSCDLEWIDGITPDGDKYDAVQRNIRGNHVAIVSTARGGPELKFGDHTMTTELKTMTIDGIACQMTDTAMVLVQKLVDQAENFKKKKKGEEEEKDGLSKDVAAKDAAIKIKDAEITELQGKLKDALDPKRTRDSAINLLAVIDKASKITGRQIKLDSVTDAAAIRREVVIGKLGDAAKDWDDNKIEGGFDAITVTSPAKGGPIADAVKVFSGKPGLGYSTDHPSGSADPRDQAYFDSVKDLENAWQKKPAQ